MMSPLDDSPADVPNNCAGNGPRDLTPKLARRRRLAVVMVVFVALIPVAIAIVGFATKRLECSAYDIHASACDVAGVAVAYAIGLFVGLMTLHFRDRRGFAGNQLAVTDILHHFSVLSLLAASAKLWVYHWSTGNLSTTIVSNLVVATTNVAIAIELGLIHVVHRCDVAPSVNLTWTSAARILKPYFWPHGVFNRLIIITTWLLMGGGKACAVVAPLFLAKAVNQMQNTPAESPYGNIAIFAMLSLAPRVLEEIQDMLVVNIWRVAYVEVASSAFRHVHSLSLEWHLQKKMGHVIRYMDRGLNAAQELVAQVAMYLGPALAVAVSAFVVFATEFKLPEVAAVIYIFMGVYVWLTIIITVWRKVFFTEANEHDNDMHDKATDSLINFETVKYFTNEDFEAQSYIKSVEEYQRNAQNSRLSIAGLNMAQATIIQTCQMVALIVAAAAVMNASEGFNLGQFMALNAYLSMLFTPFQFLGSIYETAVQNVIDMENLGQLLAAEPDLVDGPHATPLETAPVVVTTGVKRAPKSISVEFRDVSFRYPSQPLNQGLQNISFTVPAGSTTALVGCTGSGKTTVTRLLFRFYDVTGGSVLVDGIDVRDITQQSLRQHVGIVPQDTVLFNETIRHNIRYGNLSASDEEVKEAARQAQLLPLIDRMDLGWETVVGERGLKLSGGEKQRVAIARCLLKNPPVVVLDEATSALDNKTEYEVQEALKALEGRTTIIIAHRLSTIRHADQILVLSQGKVVERGSFDELLKNSSGEFASIWNAQHIEQRAHDTELSVE